MDILGTAINALVVAAVGFAVIRVSDGRFLDLKERFEELAQRAVGARLRPRKAEG
ncbi:MAG TPA: hypothetical protein VF972_11275 [Actinomycetota bacterium]